ncbi:hypothetical protein NC652_035523 [Populus alba x Populus x berolinensis]|nr:hypothetical protein NC652_035523 [Populus alba x Populus x berolinensis]
MVEISEGQKRVRKGQMEVRERFQEISKEAAKLKEKASQISKQSAANQLRLDLMFPSWSDSYTSFSGCFQETLQQEGSQPLIILCSCFYDLKHEIKPELICSTLLGDLTSFLFKFGSLFTYFLKSFPHFHLTLPYAFFTLAVLNHVSSYLFMPLLHFLSLFFRFCCTVNKLHTLEFQRVKKDGKKKQSPADNLVHRQREAKKTINNDGRNFHCNAIN